MREFDSGATRDTVEGKYDLEGFLSPAVLNRYAEYMNKHRTQADGKLRDSDNWQKGIPMDTYMKSGYRHFFDWWANHRHVESAIKEDVEESLCALIFNAMGYLYEYLKDKDGDYNATEIDRPEHKFKVGDEISIKLHDTTSDFTTEACQKNKYRGIYFRASCGGYEVVLNNRVYWFYYDEIFPVEDN